MAENFYSILTSIGKSKLVNANSTGTKLNLAKFALGDGSGNYYDPAESQTALKNEVWRGNINSINIDSENKNWIVIEVSIPASDGGFTVREAAVFDESNDMIAIGKFPETYKPALSDGSAKDLYIKMILEVSNASAVTLQIDPSIVMPTKGDIIAIQNQINNIKIPTKLPAYGGNADTVNNHTANAAPGTTEKTDIIGMVNEIDDKFTTQMTDIKNYLNYIPINGGDFDGNDSTQNVNIDGGIY